MPCAFTGDAPLGAEATGFVQIPWAMAIGQRRHVLRLYG